MIWSLPLKMDLGSVWTWKAKRTQDFTVSFTQQSSVLSCGRKGKCKSTKETNWNIRSMVASVVSMILKLMDWLICTQMIKKHFNCKLNLRLHEENFKASKQSNSFEPLTY